MENITGKGQRRARKTLHLPALIAEGESAANVIAGHRETGSDGPGAQENPGGADWDALVEVLTSNTSRKNSIAMAYHPDPHDEWVLTPTGWVRITEGEAGFTYNTGETVRL